MSAVFDASNDHLTDVTTFCETDRVVEVRFADHVGLVHVDAIPRQARFDTQNLERVITKWLRARLLQSTPQSARVGVINNQVKTVFSSMRSVNNYHLCL